MTGRFVVVGTGRSGTRWCAHLLRAAGIACGHEQVFTFRVALGTRAPQWAGYDADSSWLAVPVLHTVDVPVLLVVRHPLPVVQSMLQLGWFAERERRDVNRVIHHHQPQIQNLPTRQDKALAMWLAWNTTARARAAQVFQMEHLVATGGRELLAAAGARRRVSPTALAQITADPARRNTKADKKVPADPPRWGDFRPELAAAAQTVAAEFGYQEEPCLTS